MAHLKCGDRRSIDNTPRIHVRCRPCAVKAERSKNAGMFTRARLRSLQTQATALLRRRLRPSAAKKSDGGWIPAKKAFRWPGSNDR